MKLDKPKTTPSAYIEFGGNTEKRVRPRDQYSIKPESAQTPWVPSRFGQPDLLRAISNRRLNLNNLNYVEEGEQTKPYEMFPRKGRFAPDVDYDNILGRPQTPNYPEQQPDFSPVWNELYKLSPVIAPEDKSVNPFPRQDNMDPHGYLQAMLAQGPTTQVTDFPDLIDENSKSSLPVS